MDSHTPLRTEVSEWFDFYYWFLILIFVTDFLGVKILDFSQNHSTTVPQPKSASHHVLTSLSVSEQASNGPADAGPGRRDFQDPPLPQ